MRIHYDATLDEIIDVHWRLLDYTGLGRRWTRRGALSTGILGTLLILILTAIIPGPFALRLGIAATCGIVGALLYPSQYRKAIQQKLESTVRAQHGADAPVPFSVEPTEAGLWTQFGSTENTYAWPAVLRIVDTPDAIDFVMREAGLVTVRKRAFASPDDLQRFAALAEEYWTRAGGPDATGPQVPVVRFTKEQRRAIVSEVLISHVVAFTVPLLCIGVLAVLGGIFAFLAVVVLPEALGLTLPDRLAGSVLLLGILFGSWAGLFLARWILRSRKKHFDEL